MDCYWGLSPAWRILGRSVSDPKKDFRAQAQGCDRGDQRPPAR